jgi:hypothetical protein
MLQRRSILPPGTSELADNVSLPFISFQRRFNTPALLF